MNIYTLLAASLISAGITKPEYLEQIFNYVLTSQGKDAAGRNRVPKYVSLSPTVNVPYWALGFIMFGVVTPPQLEKVGQIVLTY